MSKFDITNRVRAAVSRSDDPHLLIDMVREEQEEHLQQINTLFREVRAIKVTLHERKELTESTVLNWIEARVNKSAVVLLIEALKWTMGIVSVVLAAWIAYRLGVKA